VILYLFTNSQISSLPLNERLDYCFDTHLWSALAIDTLLILCPSISISLRQRAVFVNDVFTHYFCVLESTLHFQVSSGTIRAVWNQFDWLPDEFRLILRGILGDNLRHFHTRWHLTPLCASTSLNRQNKEKPHLKMISSQRVPKLSWHDASWRGTSATA
jgi:hypothetical protein